MAKPAITPLNDMVLASPDEAESKTASGLYLPDNAQEKPKTATVEAVGPAVKSLKPGQKIIYNYSSSDVKHGGQEYVLVKEENVLATVN